ncbi:MAG: MCE family protein [Actinomycetota bacterium]|nr:MCE family protein [Actinomycetota bacterium]
MRQVLIGIVALALVVGSFGLTGYVLVNGGLTNTYVPAFAEFSNCGQGIRVRGDVKLRGVLVGRIEEIEREVGQNCRITMGIFPDSQDDIPANVGAQIRAKTVFGEKWVELLYPDDPEKARLAEDDVIPDDETIDPLEVETILNTALPLLESVDPEDLAAVLEALNAGFVGHEDAAIRAMEAGIEALRPLNENEGLFNKSLTQLSDTGETLKDVDDDLFAALDKLDLVQRFTIDKEQLIAQNFEKVPRLLDELTLLFSTRFTDITRMVDRGATVIGILAARSEDLDVLLKVLPQFNAAWIRNLNHNCRYRQADDPTLGTSVGDEVPGRCWRVHNLFSESQGHYTKKDRPKPRGSSSSESMTVSGTELEEAGVSASNDLGRLYLPPAELVGGEAKR